MFLSVEVGRRPAPGSMQEALLHTSTYNRSQRFIPKRRITQRIERVTAMFQDETQKNWRIGTEGRE
jgi:hypothetical protein